MNKETQLEADGLAYSVIYVLISSFALSVFLKKIQYCILTKKVWHCCSVKTNKRPCGSATRTREGPCKSLELGLRQLIDLSNMSWTDVGAQVTIANKGHFSYLCLIKNY